ncbi:MAG: ATP-grasp domain-containing protein [Candidatus Sulfotelmatobacter sp.]|jgi:carbamoyl-phosphate synthase large subunit
MSAPVRVLVTGVGGTLGQGIVKALSLADMPLEIGGCDATEDSVGAAFVKTLHRVPLAGDPAYLEEIDAICEKSGYSAVLPSTEQEIGVLGRTASPPRLPSGAVVICHEAQFFDRFSDKLSCARALAQAVDVGQFADGADAGDVEKLVAEAGFPLVVKPRRGSGSRILRVVNCGEALQKALAEVPLPFVQEYFHDELGEFSAGVFACDDFDSVLAFRRELCGEGCSMKAETSDDIEVGDYCRRIGRAMGLRGAANAQVRKTRAGVRLLEVNARFSSLVGARAAAGFRDAEWWLRLRLGMDIPAPGAHRHLRFERYFHDLVDFGDGFQAIGEWSARQQSGRQRSSR